MIANFDQFKRFDFSFWGASLGLFFIGILNLYSATYNVAGAPKFNPFKMQIIWLAFSILVALAVGLVRPKTIFRFSYIIYGINVVLLIGVIFFGTKVFGAQRWLTIGPIRFQPSEFMKISMVLAVSRWYCSNHVSDSIGLREMIPPLLITLGPTLLIIAQPDLGTGLTLLLCFFTLTFYRRLRWRTIGILGMVALIGGGFFYKYGLKVYQKQRIITFLDPWGDAHGHGYNTIQSEIAIGSGRLFGKGFQNSSQASLQFLPENHTDFVFSMFNEEHGLFGSFVLIAIYLILFLRFVWLATAVADYYVSLVSIGLVSILFWHTVINMGMTTGLLPVVGLPLPFMSYGGSGLLTFFLCIGCATSFSNSRTLF